MSRAPQVPPPVADGVELTKAQRKILTSLGHHVARLAAACDRLCRTEPVVDGLAPWLDAGRRGGGVAITGDGVFACPLTLEGARLALHPLAATQAECGNAVGALGDGGSGSRPPLTGALAIPVSLNDPLWPALLRLRPLRAFWERELRRAALDQLLSVLPDSWLLDPAPVPPGAVIPRLEIASWRDFDPGRHPGSRFLPSASPEISAILSRFPEAPGVLTALPPRESGTALWAFYVKTDERVDWLGVAARGS